MYIIDRTHHKLMNSLSNINLNVVDKEMYFFVIFSILLSKSLNTEAACSLAQRNANIPQMRIQRPDPGMYYAVDTSKRNYDVSGCPSGTVPATVRDWNEWWDHYLLNQGK